jgi:hypothetical protein
MTLLVLTHIFSYCNCTTPFYGFSFPRIFKVHIRNFVLMFYLYVNKYVI